jgi:hypothetical protein
MSATRVYWAARDLSSFFVGNHHFLLVYLSQGASLAEVLTNKVKGQRFVTLAAIRKSGNLVFQENDADDVRAVREVLDPSVTKVWKPDLDLEKHRVRPPSGGDLAFAQALVRLALNYRRRTAKQPVPYHLVGDNCAAWVNTLLRVAGVPKSQRVQLGEFSGIDWREEDLLDPSLFR